MMAKSARTASKIHLGCGSNLLDGWANIDIAGPPGVVKFDLLQPLPYPSGAADLVFSEHFIEHVRKDQAARLLAECARFLRPGGVFRVSTPDLSVLVEEYRSGRVSEWADMGWLPESPCDLINEGMRLWGHLYVWDESELTAALVRSGFTSISRVARHESAIPDLRGLECRPFHGDLILEATK
ncbi:class I SAM-dependent methyltransferase [Knoellia aerolata]|nr:methyltransferase domain-containing protein [Knoellia aerolata]